MTTIEPEVRKFQENGQPNTDAPASSVDPPDPASAPTAKPKVDPRVKALRMFATSITVFNVLGHIFLGFEQSPITPIVTVLVAYVIDLVLETLLAKAANRDPGYAGGVGEFINFLLPTHIAGLASAMLLWGNDSLWPYLFAVTVAIVSKHFIKIKVRGRYRHFLNPSNFGIALTLVIFPWVGIAPPYHFTNDVFGVVDWFIPLGILMAGTMLNVNLTKRWPLILGWVGGFIAQALLRWLLLDHALGGALMPLTGVAFILFTNYMITDPGTTPFSRRNQIVFGISVAAIYGILVSFHVVFGLFFALVLVCVFRAMIVLGIDSYRRQVARRQQEPTAS